MNTTVFKFEGLEIKSSVVKSEVGRGGSVAFLIRSSLDHRSTKNWHNFSEPSLVNDASLLEAQKNFARSFALNIRGVDHSRNIALPVIHVTSVESDRSITAVASVDLNSDETFVTPEVLLMLGLAANPEYRTSHEALLEFGGSRIKCKVVCAPSRDGRFCVLGSDFVTSLRVEDWRLYQKLLDHDVDIVYRSALQSRPNSALLIGSFGQGRPLLDRAAERLFELGYRPVFLDDFQDIPELSLDQKLSFLSSITGFTLCVDEVPAGHYTELSMCANLGVVTALLSNERFGDRASSAMLYDLHIRNRFLKNFVYSLEDFEPRVSEAVDWAVSASDDKSKLYNSIYPWRSQNAK